MISQLPVPIRTQAAFSPGSWTPFMSSRRCSKDNQSRTKLSDHGFVARPDRNIHITFMPRIRPRRLKLPVDQEFTS
ncbi:hypothetical protein LshimejAT787_1000140 [Lyophyllum shimeji]|uniref:Uncharacterized protein n=1 Tax=Lyophyllum shimeji TaxID=47721 RepID=A0A9P3PTU4_LYOSH|nr:hypothetical protein LshimejAT787_1000140 [Lyophyllum shimeji]